VNPSLKAALDVNSGRRRVDPPSGQKSESGKRPKGRHTEHKPSSEDPEGRKVALPMRDAGAQV